MTRLVATPAAVPADGAADDLKKGHEPVDLPTFSVLIAAYNGAETLPGALDSLLAQSRPDWEAIVVDDGSTDDTALVAQSFADRDDRITVIRKPNGGTSSARNAAAAVARGPLYALLDQDDYYLPDYLLRMGSFIDEHPQFDIFSCNAYHLYEDGSMAPRHPVDGAVRSFSLDDMIEGCRILPQAVFRRAVFEGIGGFDEDPRCWTEDYDFWLRAMSCGARHIYNPEPLAVYRCTSSQKSASAIACAKADAYILGRLVESGALAGRQLRRAIRRRDLQARAAISLSDSVRPELERRLLAGEFRNARRLYLRSRKGWANRRMYALGLPLMMLSPRLFARLLRSRLSRIQESLR